MNADSALREELARCSAHNDRLHDESGRQLKASLENVERKLEHFSMDEDRKHEEHRQDLKTNLEETRLLFAQEITRLGDLQEQKHCELRDANDQKICRVREDFARVTNETETKYGQAHQRLAGALETLEKDVQSELAFKTQEIQSERDQRTQKVADLCSAVKSLEAWMSDVEGLVSQKSESHSRDVHSVNLRIDEVKDAIFGIKSNAIKIQEQLDHLKSNDAAKVTGDLRKVVMDLAVTSNGQGDKIKELETTLEKANEAKQEVHRISSDLAAEVASRHQRDGEFVARLERDLRDFSSRIERLSSAADHLSDARCALTVRQGSRTGSISGGTPARY